MGKVDRIYVLSSFLENKYNRLPSYTEGKVIRSAPTFVDIEEFDDLSNRYDISTIFPEIVDSSDITISYAGSCVRTNGLFFFLNALSKVVENNKIRVRVFFVFHIGDLNKVSDYVNSLGLGDMVQIFGKTNPNYIPSLYKKSDILVLPEHGNEIANAGFPGKTGEYLISGKAIIATNFSDLSSYLFNNENSMISEIEDLEAYILNLEKIILDRNLRERIGISAIKTAKAHFDFKKASMKYVEMTSEAISN